MKTTVLLITFFFITITSFGQSKNYAERKASLEAKKEAIRKRKNEYISSDGNIYKVGDTITIYAKLGRYEYIRTNGKLLRQKRNPRDIYVIIQHIDKNTNSVGDYNLVRAICKGVEKGRYIILLDKAYQNCEIQACN